jgi:lipopolysaccharide export system protein LptA
VTFVDRVAVKIVALGTPASLTDTPELERGQLEAQGNRVEYLIEADQVTVEGDARFAHEGSEVTANQIVFDLSEAAAVATGGVRHVIQPPAVPENTQEEQ